MKEENHKLEKITEQPSRYNHLEQMSVLEILEHINEEDSIVAEAVRQVIPKVQMLVEAILPRMKRGGRLFYVGAGTSGRLGILDASELPPTYGVPETWVVGIIAGGDQALRHAVEGAEDISEQGLQAPQELLPASPWAWSADRWHYQQFEHSLGRSSRLCHRDNCRSGVCDWFYPYEVRHSSEDDFEYDFHHINDTFGTYPRQPHGQYATDKCQIN